MSDQWRLVPTEPTEEMLAAARPAYSSNIQASNTANRDKYQRMLAAAPTQGADARPGVIPEGWRMRSDGDAVVVQKDGLGGVVAHADGESIASTILHQLVIDILASRDTAPSDAAIDALKWIKVLVCGDSAPRWTNAHQTTISRGMIADIVDKAIAASAPREKT